MDSEGNIIFPAVCPPCTAASTIKTLDTGMTNSVSDCATASECVTAREYEGMLDNMQAKYNTLYAHCCNLANDFDENDEVLTLMETKLYWLKRGDQVQQELCEAQEKLTRFTLALASREKKTKHITGGHFLYYKKTEPSVMVRDKMATSNLKLRQEKGRAEIAAMAATVDQIA